MKIPSIVKILGAIALVGGAAYWFHPVSNKIDVNKQSIVDLPNVNVGAYPMRLNAVPLLVTAWQKGLEANWRKGGVVMDEDAPSCKTPRKTSGYPEGTYPASCYLSDIVTGNGKTVVNFSEISVVSLSNSKRLKNDVSTEMVFMVCKDGGCKDFTRHVVMDVKSWMSLSAVMKEVANAK